MTDKQYFNENVIHDDINKDRAILTCLMQK